MSTKADAVAPYAAVIIKLLQGVLYQDDTTYWDMLLHHFTPVREYCAKIGLDLYLDEGEGYAYLLQRDEAAAGDQSNTLPRLVRRVPLSYDVTLLCVLLRERLQQFDASHPEATRLILSADEIRDLIRPFYPEQADDVRLLRNFDTNINQVVRLGFLKKLSGQEANRYEVRRILKAKISADQLVEIKEKLERYVKSQG